MESGDGKNKSVEKKKSHSDLFIFLIHSARICLKHFFFSHMLSFYVLIVPQQDFLMLSSEKDMVKSPQDQEIVSYMWPIFDISAFFLDMFSLFIF